MTAVADYLALPKSLEEAKARGIDRFFTGVPCKHGHIAPRYTRGTNCVVCQIEHARRLGGWKARPSTETFLEKIRKIVMNRGGVLLSTEYVSAKSKVKVLCRDKHDFEITPDNLQNGRWCPECKWQNQSKRMAANYRTVEELREFARKHHGGDCLAAKPTPTLSKVMWKCINQGHPAFPAVIAKVIHSGQWCPQCWQQRRQPPQPAIPFEVAVTVVRERGGEIIKVGRDGSWKGSKTRLVIRCGNGHEWSVVTSNLVYRGSWCPECLNKGERVVRAIFETTFGGKFPKSKPEWLVSKKRQKLELDGYNHECQIAFEYQGPHHYLHDNVKAHDEIKRTTCATNGVRLIEIDAVKRPYPAGNVLQKVVEAFAKFDVAETPRLPEVEIFAAELEELRALARTKGGHLVSNVYLGGEPHEWKCEVAEHPSWLAEPWRIGKRGHWCPSCAGNRQLGLERLRAWGRDNGLELLDTEYRGTGAVYRWRCFKAAHIINRSKGNIQQSILRGLDMCTKCAGTNKANRTKQ
jgi:hypothetical protein